MTLTSIPDTRKIVWVRKPPDGEPKQCYEDSLSGAFSNGYVLCEPPGADPLTAPQPANIVAPELTAADHEAAAGGGTDNSGAIVMPEDVPAPKKKGAPRL